MKFDMNKMLQEAQRMQEELAKAQEEAATEIVEASAGGGMVTVKANGAGEIVSIAIDPARDRPRRSGAPLPTSCSQPSTRRFAPRAR